MNRIVVLQARTNSSRLPAKVLLPLAGYPVVVLAAKRAANTGCPVLVVTSKESTDDALCNILDQFGIEYFRGSLDNTLNRFISALEKYDDHTLVYRLTADNVFPDGSLLDELGKFFLHSKKTYICCNGIQSGLPYGVSAELTYLKYLREAEKNTADKHDLEHVTPYIRRKYGEVYFDKYRNSQMDGSSCTIDCLDDYLFIQRVFERVSDPISISFLDLCSKANLISQHRWSGGEKLVLGTAQFGLNYGITNTVGCVSEHLAQKIIKGAIEAGVKYLDTARAYGNSELVVGRALSSGWRERAMVITKLSPNPIFINEQNISDDSIRYWVTSDVYQSCVALGVQKLDVLMLHRANHLIAFNGMIWKRLLELKNEGVIKNLGVSIQTPEELELVLQMSEIHIIQIPFNILDHRFEHLVPKIVDAKVNRNLKIHARSVFLQGLLTTSDRAIWSRVFSNIEQIESILEWLEYQKKYTKSSSIIELCARFVNSVEWIDGLVLGICSIEQLEENLRILSLPPFPQRVMEVISAQKMQLTEQMLNPANWGQK